VDFALIDRLGDIVGPVVSHRDERTEGIFEYAFEKLPKETIFAETGMQFLPFNSALQLLAMRREGSPLLDVAEHLLMMPDLFHWLLSGEISNEQTNASTTQALRPLDGKWSEKILTAFDIPGSILSQPQRPGTTIGQLQSSVQRATALRGINVVLPPSHDTASAVLAVPATRFNEAKPDWCYISCGTWSLMGVELAESVLTAECLALNLSNEGGVDGGTRLLKNISGLWPIQQCFAKWQTEQPDLNWESVVEQANAVDAFSHQFDPDHPYFATPGDMPKKIGRYMQLAGQSADLDLGTIARTAFECLAMAYRHCLGELEALLGQTMQTVHIVGGGCRNAFLCQQTADICNRVVIAGPAEGTAMGNLMMQSIASGELSSVLEGRQLISRSSEIVTYTPQTGSRAEIDAAYQRYCLLRQRRDSLTF
jgi:rhamnulokinase